MEDEGKGKEIEKRERGRRRWARAKVEGGKRGEGRKLREGKEGKD